VRAINRITLEVFPEQHSRHFGSPDSIVPDMSEWGGERGVKQREKELFFLYGHPDFYLKLRK
jgi:hypothetical protein